MRIVAGLSLKNLQPRVWDVTSLYFLRDLQAVMVSYADFQRRPRARAAAMERGLHSYLGVPAALAVYLDNGAFSDLNQSSELHAREYEQFVENARPDWYPIPRDWIPLPSMDEATQLACFRQTMTVNRAYEHDGYVPVVHIGPHLGAFVDAIQGHDRLAAKPALAFGGIVPNLLRAPHALPYGDVLSALRGVRRSFPHKRLHVFGIGGTATMHLAALLGVHSVDSSGWRNRAARGIVQLPGTGDRSVASLGSWRGRELSADEYSALLDCQCPACRQWGIDGLRAAGLEGFCQRATHNLWVLLEEVQSIRHHLDDGTYTDWYRTHLDNSIYLPLIERLASAAEG